MTRTGIMPGAEARGRSRSSDHMEQMPCFVAGGRGRRSDRGAHLIGERSPPLQLQAGAVVTDAGGDLRTQCQPVRRNARHRRECQPRQTAK